MEDNMSLQTEIDIHNHIKLVRTFLTEVVTKLLERTLTHDESKFSSIELKAFSNASAKLSNTTYGSTEYNSNLHELQVGLDEHYKKNRHHPEHYEDGISGMTLIDLIEMICDWMASVQRHHDGDIYKSLEINKDRFSIDSQLQNILFNTVKQLENGTL